MNAEEYFNTEVNLPNNHENYTDKEIIEMMEAYHKIKVDAISDELELKILKKVKMSFDIHSDHSTNCNGYRSLIAKIESIKSKLKK